MKTVAYYISDYGYGHAARSIGVIREILNQDKDIKVIICASFALEFLRQSLPEDKVSFREIKTDVGYYLNAQSIKPNIEKIDSEYNIFVRDWKDKVHQEYLFLKNNYIALVISDIAPLPFEAASIINIPSVGISNFTWYTAYEGLLSPESLNTYKKAYEKMSHFFKLAGQNERNWGSKVSYFNFFARRTNSLKVEEIKNIINPKKNKQVIFFGLGMKINNLDINNLPLWESKDTVFITSSNVNVNKPNVYSIPSDDTESQNYIAASDLVISKAGWGTISEAVVNNIPLLLIDRKELKEDQNTISFIKEYNLGKLIEWDEFSSYKQEETLNKKKNAVFKNEVELITSELLRILK